MRPIIHWDETDLRNLIVNKHGETLVREFKKVMCIEKPSDRKELCKDIAAMANSQGGIIIYGMDESDRSESGSVASALSPIQDLSIKEKAQQIILDGIQPRLDFRFYSIPATDNTGEYVIVEIPKSLRGLHMVTLGGENRYYIRRDFQVVPMTPFEIEDAYRTYSSMLYGLENRISKYGYKYSLNTSGPNNWGAWLSVIGLPVFDVKDLFVPFSFYPSEKLNNIFSGMHSSNGISGVNSFKPNYEGLFSSLRNKEGVLLFDHVIFRDGAVRLGICFNARENKHIGALDIVEYLHNMVSYVIGLFEKSGYYSGISLRYSIDFNHGYKLGVPSFVNEMEWDVANQTSPLMGSFIHSLEFMPRDWIENPSGQLEPLLHHLWQSFGYLRCYYYDGSSGKYIKEHVTNRIRWV